MLVEIKTCRCCGSANITKNGLCQATHKQQYHCKACGKYGTLDLAQGTSQDRKQEILAAYFERPSMRGIARIFHISRNTLRNWLVAEGEKQPNLVATLHDVPTEEDVLAYDELQLGGTPTL